MTAEVSKVVEFPMGGLTLDALADKINAGLNDIGALVREARRRVEAGEAGNITWEAWRETKIKLTYAELRQRVERVIPHEGSYSDSPNNPPKPHRPTGKPQGRPAGWRSPIAEAKREIAAAAGVSERTVRRATQAPREPVLTDAARAQPATNSAAQIKREPASAGHDAGRAALPASSEVDDEELEKRMGPTVQRMVGTLADFERNGLVKGLRDVDFRRVFVKLVWKFSGGVHAL